jgi:tetratricopeptide (TPR) repeat protein
MQNENIYGENSLWDEARQYIESGCPEKAIEIYKYILLRYSDDPVAVEYANAYLGDRYLTERRLDLAEEHLMRAIECDNQKPDYHYLLGFVYNLTQRWEKATKEFKIAIQGDPKNAEYYRGLGWVLFLSGEKATGISTLQKARSMDPQSIDILCDLAMAYLDTDIVQSRRLAEQAVDIEPDNPNASRTLSLVTSSEQLLEETTSDWTPIRSGQTWVYRFKVTLKNDPQVWRIIGVKHNQLLSSLHKGITLAFNRQPEGTYSFLFSRNEGIEFTSGLPGFTPNARPAKSIRIDSIELYQDRENPFSYIYENKIWHNIQIIEIKARYTRAVYPRVIKKQGKNP